MSSLPSEINEQIASDKNRILKNENDIILIDVPAGKKYLSNNLVIPQKANNEKLLGSDPSRRQLSTCRLSITDTLL